jgi:hypothetical protein
MIYQRIEAMAHLSSLTSKCWRFVSRKPMKRLIGCAGTRPLADEFQAHCDPMSDGSALHSEGNRYIAERDWMLTL